MVRGQLIIAVWNQGGLGGAIGLYQRIEAWVTMLRGWCAGITFNIELDIGIVSRQQGSQIADIMRANMSLVGARVYGYAEGAGTDGGSCCIDDARSVSLAGVSHQGDFVQIDAEDGHERVLVPGAALGPCLNQHTCQQSEDHQDRADHNGLVLGVVFQARAILCEIVQLVFEARVHFG